MGGYIEFRDLGNNVSVALQHRDANLHTACLQAFSSLHQRGVSDGFTGLYLLNVNAGRDV